MAILFEAQDPLRRYVALHDDDWNAYIVPHHGELADHLAELAAAIAAPDRITRDLDEESRRCYYKRSVFRGSLAGDMLKVVVDFAGVDPFGRRVGRVLTAYATPVFKRGERQEWPAPRRRR